MGKTYAEELIERGMRTAEITARQQTLVRLLEKRFGALPSTVLAIVSATRDCAQLDTWLDQVVVAQNIGDFHFEP